MVLDLEKYIDEHLKEEDANIETVKSCIKDFVYLTTTTTDKEKAQLYEAFMLDLVEYYVTGEKQKFDKLITNLTEWAECRVGTKLLGYERQRIEQNKTLLNLRKL